jgi:hypothetical protein
VKPRLLDLFCGAGGAAMGSEVELAWAAGFFDGEGSVSVHRDKRPGRRPAIRLEIEQVDDRPLFRFYVAVGGLGSHSIRSGPRGPNRRVLYRIFAANEPALTILGRLWPWLSEPKREQIVRVLNEIGEGRYVAA